MQTAVKLSTPPLSLGEGCMWHAARHMLCFVDIDGKKIYGFREKEGIVFEIGTPDRVGFIVPCGKDLIAGVRDTLCFVDIDSHTVEPKLCLNLPDWIRFNDGKCAPDGNLWAGIMTYERTRPDTATCGALYGIGRGGIFQTLAPMNIPNGMAWRGSTYYHTDTATGCIDAYDYADSGISNRRVVVDTAGKSPDGFCIDDDDMLWAALWGSGRIQRFDPETGAAMSEYVEVNERNASCCCFGGDDMRTMYITTASENGEQGGLYSCRMDVTGPAPYDCTIF